MPIFPTILSCIVWGLSYENQRSTRNKSSGYQIRHKLTPQHCPVTKDYNCKIWHSDQLLTLHILALNKQRNGYLHASTQQFQ